MKTLRPLMEFMGGAEVVAGICVGIVVGAMILAAVKWAAAVSAPSDFPPPFASVLTRLQSSVVRHADFGTTGASPEVRHIADWIADSRDAAGSEFVMVDKKNAQVYVFDGGAHLLGTSPVLLGTAPGDDSVPGIGARPIAEVSLAERTTPAGRFVGERGHNARGEDVVWVDYDAGVSMHRVLTTDPRERRLERLATPTNDDNRISYGCINVPVAFYETYIQPAFARHRAIVYVLPELKSLEEVFGAHAAREPPVLLRGQAPERLTTAH